ncbi:hypothetical protein [Vibrio aestuarianus]|uniref:hypothetical protein n=1 Tax=Vibrio aestuarianus TaxID=28171 RepID=UPI00237C6C62|nr:hypothetical protein [Vibrio aestuarianus]
MISESLELAMPLLRKYEPCTVRDIACKPECTIKYGALKALFVNLSRHGVVKVVGKNKQSYVYKSTGVSPFSCCEKCAYLTTKWTLQDGRCAHCRSGRKGRNEQLQDEYSFLKAPAFKLIKRVFCPLECK